MPLGCSLPLALGLSQWVVAGKTRDVWPLGVYGPGRSLPSRSLPPLPLTTTRVPKAGSALGKSACPRGFWWRRGLLVTLSWALQREAPASRRGCPASPPPPRGHGSGTHARDQGPPRATRLPGFQMPPRGTVAVSGFLHARRHGGAFVRQRVCGMPAVPGGVGRVQHPRRGPHGHRGVVSDRSVTRRVSGRAPR